ncbi:MAG: NAD(P)H-quinone oxidoreductase [Microthrixaceae bacterium]|nr:NAD(P)H-quinone oxidoreductase [Microthrixaceae bacterium]
MRAIVLESHGGPEVLTAREVPEPVPGPEEVLIDVAATAVNRADLLQRMGLYPEPGPPRAHEVPGLELAGVVSAVGDRVQLWSPGDAVMGVVAGGAYAEAAVLHERQAMAVPERIGLPDAGALPEVFVTAYDALVLQGGLRVGGWALVHAGASGVGTAAIQLCALVGARVVVTCSAAKVAACEALGADVVVDYGSEDYVEAVDRATGGDGVDVVLDLVGGDYVGRNIRCCAVGGRIVQVGVMGGGKATVPVGEMLPRRVSLIGTVLRARPLEEKIAITQRCAADLLGAFEGGLLNPVIDRRMSLWDVAEAHEYVASNANVGKVLLEVR